VTCPGAYLLLFVCCFTRMAMNDEETLIVGVTRVRQDLAVAVREHRSGAVEAALVEEWKAWESIAHSSKGADATLRRPSRSALDQQPAVGQRLPSRTSFLLRVELTIPAGAALVKNPRATAHVPMHDLSKRHAPGGLMTDLPGFDMVPDLHASSNLSSPDAFKVWFKLLHPRDIMGLSRATLGTLGAGAVQDLPSIISSSTTDIAAPRFDQTVHPGSCFARTAARLRGTDMAVRTEHDPPRAAGGLEANEPVRLVLRC